MNNLNESQQKAVESTSTRIVCLAGAGTGKSHTLISRISNLISNRNVSASSILALTFTNAAAAEMRRRFNEIYSNLDAEFRTFHGFCYKLICTDRAVRNAIGYTNAPSIIDDAALNSLANSIKLQFGINLSDSKLKSDGEKLNSTDKFKYDVYHKKLRSCMIQRNVITFDNLCRSVCDLFISDHSSISMYKDKFKYIFVDEFQDTDKLQWSFVSSFKNASIFVCGDALQSIYSFRGADSSIIKSLCNSNDWNIIKLHQNYRSTDQICKFANSMSKYADDSYRICIDSNTQGEDVIVLPICRGINDIYNVMNELQDRPGTSAILCRTNEEVRSVCSILESKSISYWTGKSKYSDKIELLRCVGDISYSYDYMFDKLNEQEQTLVLSEDIDVKTFDELYGVFYRFETCKHDLDIISKLTDVLCSSTLNCIKVADALKILDISIEISDDIDCDAIDYLLDKLRCVSSEGVYVGTIHSSKGLEYDNVYLLNVGSDKFKLNCEENYNLYYVGITRAKNTLTVFLDDRYIF